ncbi:lactadherin-like [Patiria miniata]|uniref:Uncharacterized protein n=1 Tax=Patiria miniata TaxID=46514 RepID=A0A914BP62_PATMI|nr:lactadherin-like [Patiria miniata]
MNKVTGNRYAYAKQYKSTVKFQVIRSSQRASYIKCAAACLNEENCRYFSYTRDTRQCELSDESIVSINEENLTYHRRSGDSFCSLEGPLGMEDGCIPDESITASSFYGNLGSHAPVRARLNTEGYAAAWCNDATSDNISPWIQVDFNRKVTVTSLISQGRGEYYYYQRVTKYQVTYSNDGQSWDHVTDALGTPMKFPGNKDANTPVASTLPFALRTRILRINPTEWNNHCCMRFEVIGCF